MANDNMNEVLYDEARKRVKKRKGFYGHFSVFAVIGLFFFILNTATDPWDTWWFFPLIPWSVGLSLHYISVFGLPFTRGVLTKDWEDRETERELQKLGKKFRLSQPVEDDFEETPLQLKQVEKLRNYDDTDLV